MPSVENYRYPGSRSFSDTHLDRRLFFGREKEKQYLLHSVLVENLFVLFAKSGMGKTSLLHAGLMELLKDRGFLPLSIRFNDHEVTPVDTIYIGIEDALRQRNDSAAAAERIDCEPGEKESLWHYFRTSSFWLSEDKRLIPVLILDQFEEFFKLHPRETREIFIAELADLVRQRIPKSVRNSSDWKQRFPYHETAPPVKIIISIREDYLGYLEEMSGAIPNILENRFRLLPLNSRQAKDAIVKPAKLSADREIRTKPFSYATGTVDAMLDFLCRQNVRGNIVKTDEIEPFQLQLLCCHIENKVKEKYNQEDGEYTVPENELGGKEGMRKVLQGFYDNRIRALGSPREKIKV